MNNSIYEDIFHLGTSECDFKGLWKISSIAEALQNTANTHSRNLFTWQNELEKSNLSWVLSKSSITIERYACLGETISVKTYTKGVRALYCPRYFVVYDENRNIIARAGSLMNLIDCTSRKALSPTEVGIVIPEANNIESAIRIPLRKRDVLGNKKVFLYKPHYSDIDVNGHVNNARYLDWICNAFGFDVLEQYEIENVTVDYIIEVLPNESIEMTLITDEAGHQFRFFGCKKEKIAFDIFGTLRAK